MSVGLWWRLWLMMFLEFAIWGAWAPVLGAYVQKELHFNGAQTGWLFSILPLASIFSPMVFGQIADRYLPTQRLLAMLSFVGAILLWYMASVQSYSALLGVMLAFSIVYAPTLVLTNSLSFEHLKNAEKTFGYVRVGGTIGWMIAGYTLTIWLHLSGHTSQADSFRIAAIFSLILAVFSLALPNTPPKREGADPLAFRRAFRLLADRNFAVFMIISFIVATELQFYYVLTSPFLEHLGVKPANTSTVMTLAQAGELFVMAILLPWLLPRWGVRKMMVVGIIAWPLRYAIFSLAAYMGSHGGPNLLPLVEAALPLHGFCYVFFFVVGFIYVDTVAPIDIRASAQSLIGIVVLGIGTWIGSIVAGQIQQAFTVGTVTNWTDVFLVPCVLTVLCAIVFPLIFKDPTPGRAEGFALVS